MQWEVFIPKREGPLKVNSARRDDADLLAPCVAGRTISDILQTSEVIPLPLSSLRRGSLVDMATGQLRDEVVRGTWPVGSRIPAETELAELLGVGRSTVREAVHALVHVGLLESRQGAGTFVRALTTEPDWGALLQRAAVLEVYEVRQGLERQAAILAAQRRSPADVIRIDAALARRQRMRRHARKDAFISADLDFHQAGDGVSVRLLSSGTRDSDDPGQKHRLRAG